MGMENRLRELIQKNDDQQAREFARGTIPNFTITNLSINEANQTISFDAGPFHATYSFTDVDGEVSISQSGIYEYTYEEGTFKVQSHTAPEKLETAVDKLNDHRNDPHPTVSEPDTSTPETPDPELNDDSSNPRSVTGLLRSFLN